MGLLLVALLYGIYLYVGLNVLTIVAISRIKFLLSGLIWLKLLTIFSVLTVTSELKSVIGTKVEKRKQSDFIGPLKQIRNRLAHDQTIYI